MLLSQAIKGVLIAVVTASLIGGGSFAVRAMDEYRIASNDKRYVQQSAVDRAEINRLEEKKTDLQWELKHGNLNDATQGRKQNQLETVERLLKQLRQ